MAYDPAVRVRTSKPAKAPAPGPRAGTMPVAPNRTEKVPSAPTTAGWVTPLRVTNTTDPTGATAPARRVPDRVTEDVPTTIVDALTLNDGVTATLIGNVCRVVALP